jgi:hypothetical protein
VKTHANEAERAAEDEAQDRAREEDNPQVARQLAGKPVQASMGGQAPIQMSGKAPYEGSDGEEIDPSKVDVYRGGTDWTVKPGETKVKDGMVQSTHGCSLDTDQTYPAVASRGAHKVKSIPGELKIIQRGQRKTHFEVVPRAPMAPDKFQSLVNQIGLD